jgi:localization factor PodJL
VQEQIGLMNDRLGAAEERMSGMAAIERSISQLFQALEDSREDAHELAGEAARRAVQDMLDRQPEAIAPSRELVALEEALAAVKEQAAQSDRQTQETLQAVHETLEEIVNKLAELEAGQQETASREAEPASAEQPAQRAGPSAHTPHAATDGTGPAGDAELDFFVEPQAGIVEFQNPGARHQSHAPASDDDYIAAARRAAQTAATGSRLGTGRPPQAEQGGLKSAAKTKKAFSFSLFRRAPALKPRHPPGVPDTIAAAADSATLPQESGRRRLLLAALLLLAAVSAAALRSGFKEPSPAPVQSAPAQLGKGAEHHRISPLPLIDPLATGSLPQSTQRQVADEEEVFLADIEPLPEDIAPEPMRQAAMAGAADAQFFIAGRYLEGSGVAQDFAKAAKWYHRAALQGLAPAQYRLGTLLERGNGVRQDVDEAREWYERAALKGNVRAMHNLGVLLAGLDPPDYAGAAQWFREAAEFGVQDSQYNLAILQERGLGMNEDSAEAYFWYSVAAEKGDEDARSRAEALEASLPLALKSTVRQRLKSFQAKQAKSEANMVPLSGPSPDAAGPRL